MPAGFFLSAVGKGVTRPNQLIALLYVGIALLGLGVISLGIDLLTILRRGGPALMEFDDQIR